MSKKPFLPRHVLVPFTSFATLALAAGASATVPDGVNYGKVPLHFEVNQGQTHEDVKFLSRGVGYSLDLTATEAVLVLARPASAADEGGTDQAGGRLRERNDAQAPASSQMPLVVRMSLVGAAAKPRVDGLEPLSGKVNYFIGNDPAKWRTNVPTYAKVRYRAVYPGIDLVYYGTDGQLEYDFLVAAGVDPQSIVLDFAGVERLEVDAQGDLVMHVAGGSIRQRKPLIYQEIDGIRREIGGRYVLREAYRAGFEVSAYDTRRPLVIDPVLAYSTYLGGASPDQAAGIAVDLDGNAYVTGYTGTTGTAFPTTAGAFNESSNGSTEAFVTKLDPTGSSLVYSTYLGGSGGTTATAIAVDAAGNAYVTGDTFSQDFPTTVGAFRSSPPGFVVKLNSTGSALLYSSYLGTPDSHAIAVDAVGNAYVTGWAGRIFPTTIGAVQTTFAGCTREMDIPCGDAFVTKVNPTGTGLVYATYLGGSDADDARGIAVDVLGNAYVTGTTYSADFPTTSEAFQTVHHGGIQDAFVAKLNPVGSALVYSTYLGGGGADGGSGITVNANGYAYVAGWTTSPDFPTTADVFKHDIGDGFLSDAFVAQLDLAGSALIYSTYLGGSSGDGADAIALDANGNAYVTGQTVSTDFPTTADAFQPAYGGSGDAFVTKLNASASALVYSSYLGGSQQDQGTGLAIDITGNAAYVTGYTWTQLPPDAPSPPDFPTTAGAFQPTSGGGPTDAFVTKVVDAAP